MGGKLNLETLIWSWEPLFIQSQNLAILGDKLQSLIFFFLFLKIFIVKVAVLNFQTRHRESWQVSCFTNCHPSCYNYANISYCLETCPINMATVKTHVCAGYLDSARRRIQCFCFYSQKPPDSESLINQ